MWYMILIRNLKNLINEGDHHIYCFLKSDWTVTWSWGLWPKWWLFPRGFGLIRRLCLRKEWWIHVRLRSKGQSCLVNRVLGLFLNHRWIYSLWYRVVRCRKVLWEFWFRFHFFQGKHRHVLIIRNLVVLYVLQRYCFWGSIFDDRFWLVSQYLRRYIWRVFLQTLWFNLQIDL